MRHGTMRYSENRVAFLDAIIHRGPLTKSSLQRVLKVSKQSTIEGRIKQYKEDCIIEAVGYASGKSPQVQYDITATGIQYHAEHFDRWSQRNE